MPVYNSQPGQPSKVDEVETFPSYSGARNSTWRAAWFRVTVGRLGRALEAVQPERSSLALSTRAIVILAMVLAVGCGGSGSPTAPTPPVATAPPATPAPAPAARLVVVDVLEMISCINGLCSYSSAIRNDGDACAHNITGESWVVSAQGVEIGRARWSLPASTIIRPGEQVPYFGEGMPQIVLNHLDGRYFASFAFESGACQ